MSLAEQLTNIGAVTDAVISTVVQSAAIWTEYPFNLIIGIMIFGVGFGVVRKVLHR
jgi:hypothetical protein